MKLSQRRSWSAIFADISGWTQRSFMQPETNQSLLEIEKHPTVCCTRCGQPLRAQHVQLTITSRLREGEWFDISTILSWAKHVLKKHHCTYARDCSRIRKIKNTEWARTSPLSLKVRGTELLGVCEIYWVISEYQAGSDLSDRFQFDYVHVSSLNTKWSSSRVCAWTSPSPFAHASLRKYCYSPQELIIWSHHCYAWPFFSL